MNWKLIFGLSLLGLAMAIATVYFIPPRAEPAFWLLLIIFWAYQVGKEADEKYFLHGFLVSAVNGVWVTGVHLLLFADYAAKHGKELARYDKIAHLTISQAMLIVDPLTWLASGLILGLLALIASRFVA